MKIKGLKTKKGLIKGSKRDFLKNTFLFGAATGFLILSIFTIWVASLKIPSLDAIEKRKIEESTKIYDKNGVLLYDVHSNKKRTIITGDEISENAKFAMISIEDEDFYTHNGVRPLAVFQSVFEKLMNPDQRLRGGSTITQQVVKNSILTAERSISRKVKEWVLAYKLEDILSKDEILSMYLNEISFGGTIYGIEQASLSFFGKKASELNVAEAAYLAAIPKAPTYYSPFGKNVDELEDRKNLVLSQMFDLGFITKKEYIVAKEEIVVFERNKIEDRSIKAPHFVLMLREILEEKYGRETIENGGLSVYTTIDYELQKDLEEIVNRNALENEQKYDSENAGLVALESKTGKVIAMVGSRDYFDENIDGKFNIATALRQPGSTFKPLIYALAFEKGYLPESAIWDTQTEFSTACFPDGEPISGTNKDNCYNPVNFDYKFKGPMNMRNALAQSRNIPAVKAAYLAGLKESLALAHKFGLDTLKQPASFYGLGLVLGGGEVRLVDMVSAYSAFSNSGTRVDHQYILRIEDKSGNIIEEYQKEETKVISKNAALMISDVLSDKEAKLPTYGAFSPLYYTDRQVAAKTGTTNDSRDVWTIGYDNNVTVGVWGGNNDNRPMGSATAGFVIVKLWRESMDRVLQDYPSGSTFENWNKPQDYESLKSVLKGSWQGQTLLRINTETGEIITNDSVVNEDDPIVEINSGEYHSVLHFINTNNPTGSEPINPDSDIQYERWEHGVQEWVKENKLDEITSQLHDLLEISNNIDNEGLDAEPGYKLDFDIRSPKDRNTYRQRSEMEIEIRITENESPIDEIRYYLNDDFLGSTQDTEFEFIPNDSNDLQSGFNDIRVVVKDKNGKRVEKSVRVRIRR